MPLGVGIGLATGKHAVCFVGDGGSLFSIHALWTAAKYAIPSIFVCFVNHEYRLLKDLWCNAMGTTIETTQFVGMDFDNPNLNMQGIAEGFGARIEKIETFRLSARSCGVRTRIKGRASLSLIVSPERRQDFRSGSFASSVQPAETASA